MREKYLIMKLDETSMLHLPERISDIPLVFDTTIPENELQEYTQIVLRGNEFELKTLEDIIFPGTSDEFATAWGANIMRRIRKVTKELDMFKEEIKLEENLHDAGREVSGDKSGDERTESSS